MGIERHFRPEALDRYRSGLDDPELSPSNHSGKIRAGIALAICMLLLLGIQIIGLKGKTRTVSYACVDGRVYLALPATRATRGLISTSDKHFPVSIQRAGDGKTYVASGLSTNFCDAPRGSLSITLY